MVRFNTIADLSNPGSIGRLTGPITGINTAPLNAIGFSGSSLHRLELCLQTGTIRNLVLKQTKLRDDWISQRTRDSVGREQMVLAEPALSEIWKIIHSPYIAFATENGSTGLLMDDYSAYLFPDVRETIEVAAENIIIDTIASMHASFWNSPAIKSLSWLAGPCDYLDLLRPGDHKEDEYCPPPPMLRDFITEGWNTAMQLLPGHIKDFLTQPVEKIFEPWKNLPVTFLHGDLKMANMAIIPGNKLVLIDWSMTGCAPSAMELGWYIAVNSSRLAETKEIVINKYRSALESHLQCRIEEDKWKQMKELAIVTGSMMLLWNKALGFQTGKPNGKEEWEWWVAQLDVAMLNLT